MPEENLSLTYKDIVRQGLTDADQAHAEGSRGELAEIFGDLKKIADNHPQDLDVVDNYNIMDLEEKLADLPEQTVDPKPEEPQEPVQQDYISNPEIGAIHTSLDQIYQRLEELGQTNGSISEEEYQRISLLLADYSGKISDLITQIGASATEHPDGSTNRQKIDQDLSLLHRLENAVHKLTEALQKVPKETNPRQETDNGEWSNWFNNYRNRVSKIIRDSAAVRQIAEKNTRLAWSGVLRDLYELQADVDIAEFDFPDKQQDLVQKRAYLQQRIDVIMQSIAADASPEPSQPDQHQQQPDTDPPPEDENHTKEQLITETRAFVYEIASRINASPTYSPSQDNYNGVPVPRQLDIYQNAMNGIGNTMDKRVHTLIAELKDLRGAIDIRTKELNDPSKLSDRELVDRLLSERLVVTEDNYGRGIADPERRALVREFMQRDWGNAEINPDDVDRNLLKIHYLLETIVIKTSYGKQAAAIRDEIFGPPNSEGKLGEHLVSSREDLIRVTTYHPFYGKTIREMIRFLIENPIRELDPADEPVSKVGNYKYETLADEGGYEKAQAMLREGFDENRLRSVPEEMREILYKVSLNIFYTFDMLAGDLAEAQLKRRTRSHNSTTEKREPVTVQNPFADMVHQAFGYPGNKEDPRLWLLTFLDLSDRNAQERIGIDKPKDPNAPFHGGSFEELVEKQRLVRDYYRAISDIPDGFFDSIRLPSFARPVLLDTYDLVELSPGERIKVGGQVYDHQGNVVNTSPTPIDSFDKFKKAFEAYYGLLEYVTGDLPDGLTDSQIVQKVQGQSRGGLLYKWLSEAGKAKIFKIERLAKVLPPLLFDYILRLYMNYTGDLPSLKKLHRDVIQELKDAQNVGLNQKATQDALNKTINMLESLDLDHFGFIRRKDKVRAYAKRWFVHNFPNEKPPARIPLVNLRLNLEPTDEQELYHEIMSGNVSEVPAPFHRSSNLVPKDKE